MGQLRRAVSLIAATLAFTTPGPVKAVKLEIMKIEPAAFEVRSFVRDRPVLQEDARLFTAASDQVGFWRRTATKTFDKTRLERNAGET